MSGLVSWVAVLQWLVLGDEHAVAKEKAWARKQAADKGLAVQGRAALINALLQQKLDRGANVLFVL